MRTIDRIGAAVAGFALVAAPVALAAPTLDEPAEPEKLVRIKGDDVALSDVRAADAVADAARRERRDGPFHPVVIGAVDYGEADARFGASRSGHVHEGQDVFAPSGTPLVAVADGEVVEVGSDGGRGNYASIYDPAEKRTYNYFHMVEAASVTQGDEVRAGERIGGVGCTGSCWGDHLHFEVHQGRDPYGPAIDPLPLLEKLPQAKG
jgi:murein DD-endopeptidase MepM/ murein hydrolase activator NlpD